MNPEIHNYLDEELKDEIISAAYGDAPLFVRIKILLLSLTNKEIRNLYKEYKTTVRGVRLIKPEEFPEESLKNVLEKITDQKVIGINPLRRNRNKAGRFAVERTFSDDFLYIIFKRPVVSLLTALVLIAAVTFSVIKNQQAPSYSFSKYQIENADKQVAYTLALIGKIFDETQNTISEEILKNKVSKPINQSVDAVFRVIPQNNVN